MNNRNSSAPDEQVALAAENWRLRNILNGIQAAIDPDKKLSQQELVGQAWALVRREASKDTKP